MRSITGVPFRSAVISVDGQHLIVIAADKTNRDCILTYNGQNGTFIHRISLKSCGIKVNKLNNLQIYPTCYKHKFILGYQFFSSNAS